MKILQANIGRGRAAHDLVFLTTGEDKAEIIVVASWGREEAGVSKNAEVVKSICV